MSDNRVTWTLKDRRIELDSDKVCAIIQIFNPATFLKISVV